MSLKKYIMGAFTLVGICSFSLGATFTVTNSLDSGAGSLRAAIGLANADATTPRVINFNIPGGGVQTITLASALPQVTKFMTIDATTQPGYAGTPLVVLDGNFQDFDGLVMFPFFTGNSNNKSAVKALCIVNCGTNGGTARNGLVLKDGDSVTVSGCYLGINATGATAARNTGAGIRIELATAVIGGTNAAARNVISGNLGAGIDANTDNTSQGSPVTVTGNYIGTSADGMSAVPNAGDGINAVTSVSSAPLTIGSAAAGGGNVISGNGGNGVRTQRPATISANLIGLAADGATARSNALNGVSIEASISVIGNGTANRNVISANGGDGVRVSGSTTPGNRSTIRDNYIGTDATGMLARGNGGHGVEVVAGAAAIGANLISANTGSGVCVASGDGNITTCKIGVNADATAKLGNGGDGITITNVPGITISQNTIGGNTGSGINITGVNATNITITGNVIGTSSGGTANLGNGGNGIAITGGAQHEIVGSATAGGTDMNLAPFDGLFGIVSDACNRILFNASYANGLLALNPPGGAPNPAAITSAAFNTFGDVVTIGFNISDPPAANTLVRVLFAGNPAQGQDFTVPLGSTDVTLDGSGSFSGSAQFGIPIGSARFIVNYLVTAPTSNPNTSCSGKVSLGFDTSGGGSVPPIINLTAGAHLFSANTDEPINTFSGELFDLEALDLNLGGPMPLVFARYYASLIAGDGYISSALGRNRLHNFDAKLAVTSTNATAILNDGRAVQFTKNANTWSLAGRTDIAFQLVTNGPNFILADPRSQMLYTFDGNGNLSTIADGHGNAQTLSYTGSQLASVTDGLGRMLTFQYNSSGFLTNVSDGARSVVFGYTGSDLTTATDPLGHTTIFAYDGSGHLLSTQRPLGNTPFSQTYDANARVATQTEHATADQITTLAYNTNTLATTITNSVGKTRIHTHIATGELSAFTDEEGKTVTLNSDATGRRSLVTDRLGNTTAIGYHAPSSKPSALTNADGTVTLFNYSPRTNSGVIFYDLSQIVYPDNAVETFSYDANGNMLKRTDRAGRVFGFSYNARGQMLTATNPLGGVVTFTYNADGTLGSQQDTDTGLTTFAYDSLKRLTNVIHPDAAKISAAYDANDRLASITDERGNTTQFANDANDRLAQITDANGKTGKLNYDSADRLVQTIDRLGQAAGISYDPLDHVAAVTNRNGNVTRYTYDTRQRLAAVTDPGSQVWNFSYDNEGRLTAAANPLNQTNQIGRDQLGYETSATNALGQSASVVRDAMRRVTQTIDAILRTNRYSYDSRGLLTNATRPLIGGASFQRNDLGQLSRITGLNGEQWTFGYTPMGRLQSSVDPLNRAATNFYDIRGRLQKTIFADGTTRSNSYDATSNLTRRKYSAGPDLQYTYDALNRLVTADNLAFSYDAEDRVTNTVSSGFNYGATYDLDGRLSSVSYHNGTFTVNYAYDSRDRLTQVSDTLTGTMLTFSYDDAGRLTGITRPNGVNATYTYDAAGRLIRIQEGSIIDLKYGYNADGEVTNANFTAPLDPANFLAPANPAFSYDAAHQIANPGYGFDARGRQTASPGHTFSWDGASRLAGIDASTFVYNGMNDIISRTANSLTDGYFYNYAVGLAPIMYEASYHATLGRFYVWAPGGRLLYIITAGGGYPVSHVHCDRVGSVLALTSSAGAVTDAYAYSPYGMLLGHTGANTQPFTFVGAFGVRAEGSLYQMRARYYDPLTARFISRDPGGPQLADVRTLDPYLYALGDPTRYIDPKGLDAHDETAFGLFFGKFLLGLPLPGESSSETLNDEDYVFKPFFGVTKLPYANTAVEQPTLPANEMRPNTLNDLFAGVGNNDNGLVFDAPPGIVDTQIEQPTLPANEVFTAGGKSIHAGAEFVAGAFSATGFEKTFLDGSTAVGLQLQFIQAGGASASALGDLSVISKYARLNDSAAQNLYTGISLNYRFLATASVHTYEEEEDRANPRPAPRRIHRRPVPPNDDSPPVEAPPASPESVD